MKKFLLPALALVLAIGFASFKTVQKKKFDATVYAEFSGTNVLASSETDFEDPTKWNITNSIPESCPEGNGVCYVPIDSTIYQSSSGIDRNHKFANFLASQDGDPGEASSATAYVTDQSPARKFVSQ